jgi:hypothetical protein
VDVWLSSHFRAELPSPWPAPPWRSTAATKTNRRSWHGKALIVAALVLASLGLSLLGEVPGSWPPGTTKRLTGSLEARRPGKAARDSKGSANQAGSRTLPVNPESSRPR